MNQNNLSNSDYLLLRSSDNPLKYISLLEDYYNEYNKAVYESLCLATACVYKNHNLYFGWYIDFRGRAYSVGYPLHPHGSALARALLIPVCINKNGDILRNTNYDLFDNSLYDDIIYDKTGLYPNQLTYDRLFVGKKKVDNLKPIEYMDLYFNNKNRSSDLSKIDIDVKASAFQIFGLILGEKSLLEYTRFIETDKSVDFYNIIKDDLDSINLEDKLSRAQIKKLVIPFSYNEGSYSRKRKLKSFGLS